MNERDKFTPVSVHKRERHTHKICKTNIPKTETNNNHKIRNECEIRVYTDSISKIPTNKLLYKNMVVFFPSAMRITVHTIMFHFTLTMVVVDSTYFIF